VHLYRAQQLDDAFQAAFKAGRIARTKELKAFIEGAGIT
jgi:hypothetical protein